MINLFMYFDYIITLEKYKWYEDIFSIRKLSLKIFLFHVLTLFQNS